MTKNTEPEEVNGIEGQIIHPDPETDAERAGAWVAGKVGYLTDADEERAENEDSSLHRVSPQIDGEPG